MLGVLTSKVSSHVCVLGVLTSKVSSHVCVLGVLTSKVSSHCICVCDIDFASFYDFSIGFCSELLM